MLALLSCIDENLASSFRASDMAKLSCVQSCPMYFSWEMYEAEMLSGRLAQPERMAIANERIWSFFEFILVSYQ